MNGHSYIRYYWAWLGMTLIGVATACGKTTASRP
jgi:hypothetical protein